MTMTSYKIHIFLTTLLLTFSLGIRVQGAEQPAITIDASQDTSIEISPPDVDSPLYQQVQKDRESYEQVVLELESQQDMANPLLAETYLSLGDSYRALGLLEEAIESFNSALQLIRTNNGLNSLQQIPALEKLIISNQEYSQWVDVDKHLYLMLHVMRKSYPAGHPKRTWALDQLRHWHLKTFEDDLLPFSESNTRNIINIYQSELRQLEDLDGITDNFLLKASLLLGEAELQYLLALKTMEQPLSNFQDGTQRTITQQICRIVPGPDGRPIQVCEAQEIPNVGFYLGQSDRRNQLVGNHLSQMRSAIQQAHEILRELPQTTNDQMYLLTEVNRLTHSYNEFINTNGNK